MKRLIEQITFDFDRFNERLSNRLEVGDSVEVSAVPDETQSIETFYYITEFTAKKGTLLRINRDDVPSFEVEFKNGKIGVFYEHEIVKIQGGNLE